MEEPKKKSILVVEDELPLLKAVKSKLEISGFEVVTARTVTQALNALEDINGVDIVWCDHYLLGEETGLDFVSKLKKNDNWKNIPIFIVSVTASPKNVQAYLALGIKKFYTKHDYKMDEIITDIKRIMSEEEK